MQREAPPPDLDLIRTLSEHPDEKTERDWVPSFMTDLAREERAVVEALGAACPALYSLPGVKGSGVGLAAQSEEEAGDLAGIVFVDANVSEKDRHGEVRVPEFLEIGGQRVPIRVITLGDLHPLQCIPGIPIQQHHRIRPVKPGTAIRGLDPNTGQPVTDGTGGAIVRRLPADPNAPVFLLSAGHVLSAGGNLLNMMQPWLGNPANDIIGSTIGVAAQHDAGICEIPDHDPAILCIGRPNPPVPPVIGLPLQKSGAATGHTASAIQYTATGGPLIPALQGTSSFFVANDAAYPMPSPGDTQNFVTGGDSGALAVVGNPNTPGSYGPRVNARIRRVLRRWLPPALHNAARMLIARRLKNAAVGLVTHTTAGVRQIVGASGAVVGQENYRVGVCLEIQTALNALQVGLV